MFSATPTNSRRRAWTWLLSACAACVWPVAALAQQGPDQWVRRGDVPQETLAASPLVLTAYAFVWVALVVYVFLLWRRLGRVEQELQQVTAKISTSKRP